MAAATSHGSIRRTADAIRSAGAPGMAFGIACAPDGPDLSAAMQERTELPFDAVDGMPASWSQKVGGRFVLGEIGGRGAIAWVSPCAAAAELSECTFGTRVAVELGVETIVVSGTVSPINPTWSGGGAAVIFDHINLSGSNPLLGPNLDEHGPRFPDLSFVYDADLRRRARQAAMSRGVLALEGTVALVRREADLTASDRDILRGLGADAFTSAMVPDAIVARHAERRVLALARVNPAKSAGGQAEPVDLAAVLSTVFVGDEGGSA